MLKIATVNVNGIRAAFRKGMPQWLEQSEPDIITMQEVRAPDEVLHELFDGTGYHLVHTEASDKGRAGVAIASKTAPKESRIGVGDPYFDDSGRWIEADFTINKKKLTIVSAYVHSGEVGTKKQDDKYRFLDQMVNRLPELQAHNKNALITGDMNVGHTELDIKNWKGNVKNAGFLPEERAYFDRFFGELGWVDVHRKLSGEVPGPYTWWSWRGRAFDTDTGWRIDYQMATSALAKKAANTEVHRAPTWNTRWSDHAPLVVEYDF